MSQVQAPASLRPIEPGARLTALDAARGLALLGIFCVNIQLFSQPFGLMTRPIPPEGAGVLDVAAHWFVDIFCEGKFYPLFSAMFGMGLVLQMGRADATGRAFGGLYARRLAVLLLMGLAHALLVWYGDVLFYYAIAGAILLLCSRLTARALVRAGIGLGLFAALLTAGFSALSAAGGGARPEPASATSGPSWDEGAFFDGQATEGEQAPAADDAPPGDRPETEKEAETASTSTPFGRFITAFQSGQVADPLDPIWLENERLAYRDGPYSQVFLFRAMTWAMMVLVSTFTFGWHILAMFFLGAGLMKAGFFESPTLPRRFAMAGLTLGLPLGAGAWWLLHAGGGAGILALGGGVQVIGGSLMALGYLGGVTLFARSGALAGITRSFARVGRMALTNYLMQSLIATYIFYYFGLGMFGEFSRAQGLALVFGIYAFQHIFSLAWLSVFAIGPAEWIWRTLTYLRPPTLLKG
jgi:uncharacterized protein